MHDMQPCKNANIEEPGLHHHFIQLFVSDCHSLLVSQTMGLIQICFTASACGRRIHDGLVRRWAWLPQRNFSLFADKLTGFDLKQRLPGMMIPVDYTIFLVEMSANQWNIYRQVCCLCWLDFAMDVGHVPGLCENLCIWFYNITPHRFMFW